MPTFGFLVVKGYVEILADCSVAALKNVVFPVLVFPMRPIRIIHNTLTWGPYSIAMISVKLTAWDRSVRPENIIKAPQNVFG